MAATPSGAPWMVAILEEQRRRGHDVSAVIAGRDGTLAPILAGLGIPFEIFPFGLFGRGVLGASLQGLRLVRLLRRLRADVVQTHLFPSIVLGRIASWAADVPLRYSMIPGPYYLECPVLGDLEAGTAWADTRVIASCERTRELYMEKGVPRERVDLVYYGVDPARFDPARADGGRVRRELGISPGIPVVGLVAYFYPKVPDAPTSPTRFVGLGIKGHDVLLAAVPEVLRHVPDAVFLLVGGGWGAAGDELLAETRALAERLGVAHAVRFTGERRDVADVLAALDVSLQCSRSENLGGAIEALLMARPLVVTRVGGLVDAVKDGKTGLVVPPDDAASLAAAIVLLLRDRDLAGRLGDAGRSLMAERFSLARTVDDLERIYHEDAAAAGNGQLRGYRPSVTAARLAAVPFRSLPALARARRAWRAPRRTTAGDAPLPPPRTASGVPSSRVALVVGVPVGSSWLVDHARGLKARGWDVVVTVDSGPGGLAPLVESAGVPVRRLPLWVGPKRLRALTWLAKFPGAARALARQFLKDGVTLVVTHQFTSILIARAAARIAGIPHVSMVPGPRHLEALATRVADRLTWRTDAATVAGCRHTRDLYVALGRDPRRLETIYYGLDPDAVRPVRARADVRRGLGLADDAEVVVHVAHFYPPITGVQVPGHTRGLDLKGRGDLLDAARALFARRPRARLLFVGGGLDDGGEAYRGWLADRCASDPALAGRVLFTGHRDDVADLLAASDVAVQCSLTENLGGTLESLVLARPTVATRVGGMPESVKHGLSGLLVPPSDPRALAAAIERLLENPAEAEAMGRAGRTLVLERFTLSRTLDELSRLFVRLGQTPSRPTEAA
ncbi:MAG TPA: glycosyltransferase family 4 protein [Thermoanaerobaculia bacterium]|nr:glycosyltransferase family 4 protein [Thermoanaerobaculia bacterium]